MNNNFQKNIISTKIGDFIIEILMKILKSHIFVLLFFLKIFFIETIFSRFSLFFLQKHYFTLKRRCSIKMRFVGVINQNCAKILVRVSLYTSMFYVVTRKPCVFKVFHTEYTDLERIANSKFIPFSQLTEAF